MNRNVNTCVRLFAQTFDPPDPILEIGSLYLPGYAAVADLRPLFPGKAYLGCDIRQGLGVDRIEDAEALSFDDGSFGTVLMCEVIAHLRHPERALAEARRVLREDGLILISTPFDYRLNGFPDDYRRLTASGLDLLLEDFGSRSVIAVGPRSIPSLVVGVATKEPRAAFERMRHSFEASVAEAYRRSWVRQHLGVMGQAGRQLLGCALGRAHLGVEVFDPLQPGVFRNQAVDDHESPEPHGDARR